MGRWRAAVYRDRVMTADEADNQRSTMLSTAVGALWSARSWRATAHALIGLPVGMLTCTLTVGLPVGVAVGAIRSLLHASPDGWVSTMLWVVLAVLIPLPMLLAVPRLTALQRLRFRALLGVEIPPALRDTPRPHLLPTVDTLRQVAYHVLALFLGVVGAAVTATFWLVGIGMGVVLPLELVGWWNGSLLPSTNVALGVLALAVLLAAPWVARGVAHIDTAAARALLGPSRSEELSALVAALAQSRADILAATEAERRRIELALHDGTQQRLVALAMTLGTARATLTDLPEPARVAMESAHDEATLALAELREFVHGLQAAELNVLTSDPALRTTEPESSDADSTDSCQSIVVDPTLR